MNNEASINSTYIHQQYLPAITTKHAKTCMAPTQTDEKCQLEHTFRQKRTLMKTTYPVVKMQPRHSPRLGRDKSV